MKLTGVAPTGESLRAGSGLARRLYGWRRFSFFIYIAVLGGQTWAWFRVPEVTGLNESLAGLGFVATTAAIIFGYLRWCQGLGQRGWERLGALPEIAFEYESASADLKIISGNGVQTVIPWSAIASLCEEKTLWLFITTGGSAVYLPRRFFADLAQEKAFVAQCLESMSPNARSRSGEAAAFADQS